MKDLLELLKRVFGNKHKNKLKRRGLPFNHNPDPGRNVLPKIPPSGPPMRADPMKNKDRITELESEVEELKQTVVNQTKLLERLVRELGELNRDVAHLLPEK